MNQPQLGNFESIALAAIRPSPTNPRKHFDQLQLEELARSIGEMGVTNPLLLRPWPVGVPLDPPSAYVQYEIVAGERRYRAAELAGVAAVPAIVREMSDAEVLNTQIVENLQRADLHPMEEAEGYQALIESGTSIEGIAKRTGKTYVYVQQRVRLLTLIPDSRDLFSAGDITLGHALILARLQPEEQDKALRYLVRAEGDYKKMSTAEVIKARRKNIATNEWARHRDVVEEKEGELREWVTQNVMLQLKDALWRMDDAELVPEAGSCTTCQKRTGTDLSLFADITTDEGRCLDASCFAAKQKAVQVVTIQAAAVAGEHLVKVSSKTGHKPIDALSKQNPGPEAVKAAAKKAAKKTAKKAGRVDGKSAAAGAGKEATL